MYGATYFFNLGHIMQIRYDQLREIMRAMVGGNKMRGVRERRKVLKRRR